MSQIKEMQSAGGASHALDAGSAPGRGDTSCHDQEALSASQLTVSQ